MGKYKTILFDVDGTLLDFKKDQDNAFNQASQKAGFEFTNQLYEDYCRINKKCWEQLELGKITRRELLFKRFKELFELHEIEVDPEQFQELYSANLQKTGTVLSGAHEILSYLKGKYELAIATNANKKEQTSRLKNANLFSYFSNIFISEEIGYPKPNIRFFESVCERIVNRQKDKILIVGDSLSSDIKGGYDFGIDTCWYHSKEKANTVGIKPTYEISSLLEIKQIL